MENPQATPSQSSNELHEDPRDFTITHSDEGLLKIISRKRMYAIVRHNKSDLLEQKIENEGI